MPPEAAKPFYASLVEKIQKAYRVDAVKGDEHSFVSPWLLWFDLTLAIVVIYFFYSANSQPQWFSQLLCVMLCLVCVPTFCICAKIVSGNFKIDLSMCVSTNLKHLWGLIMEVCYGSLEYGLLIIVLLWTLKSSSHCFGKIFVHIAVLLGAECWLLSFAHTSSLICEFKFQYSNLGSKRQFQDMHTNNWPSFPFHADGVFGAKMKVSEILLPSILNYFFLV